MQRKGMNLLLAGLAAYGYYRFSKMSPTEKTALKTKARKFVNDNVGGLGNIFGRRTNVNSNTGI